MIAGIKNVVRVDGRLTVNVIFVQHEGLPYCDVPCYCALFGPRVFHRGVGGFEFTPPDSPVLRRPSSTSTTARSAAESMASYECVSLSA